MKTNLADTADTAGRFESIFEDVQTEPEPEPKEKNPVTSKSIKEEKPAAEDGQIIIEAKE